MATDKKRIERIEKAIDDLFSELQVVNNMVEKIKEHTHDKDGIAIIEEKLVTSMMVLRTQKGG